MVVVAVVVVVGVAVVVVVGVAVAVVVVVVVAVVVAVGVAVGVAVVVVVVVAVVVAVAVGVGVAVAVVMVDAEMVLLAARELVRSGWTRGDAAVDAKGKPVNAGSPDARSFCAYGALCRACVDLGVLVPEAVWYVALDRVAAVLPPLSTGGWMSPGAHLMTANDATTRETVLAWFDKAIG